MLTRGTDTSDQALAWDVENRPSTVSENSTVIASFVYDGDGNRVKKTEDGNTVIYVNRYYEVNVTTATATSNYYLGGKLVAIKEGDDLRYVHADHLGSTSLMTDETGLPIDAMTYKPYGETLSGDVPTDIKFTGQRLDSSGLYFYNARYYDAFLGRFISPDTIIPNPASPQAFNRYSYCLNNPLKYVDPSGHIVLIGGVNVQNIDKAVNSGDYMRLVEAARATQNDRDILIAYGMIRAKDTIVTNMLEEADSVINIVKADISPQYVNGTKYNIAADTGFNPENLSEIRVRFNSSKNNTPQNLIGDLSHELVHAFGCVNNLDPFYGVSPVSKFEENIANTFASNICSQYGFEYSQSLAFSPWIPASLEANFRRTYYESYPTYPVPMNGGNGSSVGRYMYALFTALFVNK